MMPHHTPSDSQNPTAPAQERRAMLAGLGGLAAGAMLAGGRAAHAGPLDPPAGPVTSTGKTLTEIEPRLAVNSTNTPGDDDSIFKITQAGSYYLAADINGLFAPGKMGIEIAASHVTLDLMGFEVRGGIGTLDGIAATGADRYSITIHNGAVHGWGGDGVDLTGSGRRGGRVQRVRASDNGASGIRAGFASSVSDCSAFDNAESGISTLGASTISNSVTYGNGVNGISTEIGCTVTGCTAYFNGVNGISTENGCMVTGCAASFNLDSGITTDDGCTVTGCSAFQNTGRGISVSNGTTITDCAARSNHLDGIACGWSCMIRGNVCVSNGAIDGAGIHATGSNNRIEGNNCTYADRGIDVDQAGNIIIMNTCSFNTTNWTIVAGNALAPIVAASTNLFSVSGNTYGGSLGSTDPNANFSY